MERNLNSQEQILTNFSDVLPRTNSNQGFCFENIKPIKKIPIRIIYDESITATSSDAEPIDIIHSSPSYASSTNSSRNSSIHNRNNLEGKFHSISAFSVPEFSVDLSHLSQIAPLRTPIISGI